MRLDFAPVNASWPFPRSLEIYEEGLFVRSLGSSAWIPRVAIMSLRRGWLNIQVTWELGGGTRSATVVSWLHIGRIQRAFESDGYSVARR